ncbi:MAG TPA: hypothetical protein ENJ95_09290 [Bacteroidetes bacterium]|nr:hypothetical protein [Bacteroidota bacterium]
MKIRILNNSVRLRLTQTEVRSLQGKGKVEAQINFGAGPAHTLVYAIKKADVGEISATFNANRIEVVLPVREADAWAASSEVALEKEQLAGNGNTLRILVEKDFKCLTKRKGEDESDHFPNPAESC